MQLRSMVLEVGHSKIHNIRKSKMFIRNQGFIGVIMAPILALEIPIPEPFVKENTHGIVWDVDNTESWRVLGVNCLGMVSIIAW